MKRTAIAIALGLLTFTTLVAEAPSEDLDCASSTLDTDVPQSGTMTGTSRESAQDAVDSIVEIASNVTCGPCDGLGCSLSGAGTASGDIIPGDGGLVFYGLNEEWFGITVLWGDNGGLRVSCSACQ